MRKASTARRLTNRARTLRGPAPRYALLKQEILERIASGEWGDGCRLPSEHEMVRQYGMSRMTVHRALRELSAQGVLARRKGIGTFVLPPAPRSELLAIRDIAEDVVQRGHVHRGELVALEAVRANYDLATSFSKAVGAKLFRSLMVHFEDRAAIQLEERFVNPEFAPGYLDADFRRVTPARYLRELAPPTEVEHIIFAGLADERQARLLRMKAGEPCLFMMRRTWCARLTATRSLFVYPAGGYSLGSRYRVAATGLPAFTTG